MTVFPRRSFLAGVAGGARIAMAGPVPVRRLETAGEFIWEGQNGAIILDMTSDDEALYLLTRGARRVEVIRSGNDGLLLRQVVRSGATRISPDGRGGVVLVQSDRNGCAIVRIDFSRGTQPEAHPLPVRLDAIARLGTQLAGGDGERLNLDLLGGGDWIRIPAPSRLISRPDGSLLVVAAGATPSVRMVRGQDPFPEPVPLIAEEFSAAAGDVRIPRLSVSGDGDLLCSVSPMVRQEGLAVLRFDPATGLLKARYRLPLPVDGARPFGPGPMAVLGNRIFVGALGGARVTGYVLG